MFRERVKFLAEFRRGSGISSLERKRLICESLDSFASFCGSVGDSGTVSKVGLLHLATVSGGIWAELEQDLSSKFFFTSSTMFDMLSDFTSRHAGEDLSKFLDTPPVSKLLILFLTGFSFWFPFAMEENFKLKLPKSTFGLGFDLVLPFGGDFF